MLQVRMDRPSGTSIGRAAGVGNDRPRGEGVAKEVQVRGFSSRSWLVAVQPGSRGEEEVQVVRILHERQDVPPGCKGIRSKY
jgi:plasmid stabilization system protein ParE